MSDTASLLSLICIKCGRANWYGGWDFRSRTSRVQSTTAPTSAFAYAVATEQQVRETERIIGFPLPPLLRLLYTELANGGFGPGGGLRGAVGGFGTVGFPLPNGQTCRNDETLVKYHIGSQLVDLDTYAPQWQQKVRPVVYVSYDLWPFQLVPLCDLGDQVEMCVDWRGHLFSWEPSEQEGLFQFTDRSMSLEQWLLQWIRDEPLL